MPAVRRWFVDEFDAVAVHLVHPHDPVGAQADRVGEAFPVGRHGGGIIADMVTEIEGVERRCRDTTGASGGHTADADGHVANQWRMNGGTSTSSSEIPSSPPPTRTVAPLVYVGVLAASAGSNTDEVTPGVTAPARADAMT